MVDNRYTGVGHEPPHTHTEPLDTGRYVLIEDYQRLEAELIKEKADKAMKRDMALKHMTRFAIAMSVEADTGKKTIYQDIFTGVNKHEALGKALESFIRGGQITEFSVKPIQDEKNVSQDWLSHLARYTDTDIDLVRELIDLLKHGKTINAIKLYREQTGASLIEAKNYVDDLRNKCDLPH